MSARVPRAAKRPLERVTGARTGIGVLAVWGVPDGDADADPGALVSGAGQGGQASRRGPVQGGQGMSAGSGDVLHQPGFRVGNPQREPPGAATACTLPPWPWALLAYRKSMTSLFALMATRAREL